MLRIYGNSGSAGWPLLGQLALIVAMAMPGCAARGPGKEQLVAGYRDLEQHRYEQAFAAADSFLKQSPSGLGSAEALYLQGRVYEARAEAAGNARQPDAARAELRAAADAYQRALGQSPAPPLQGLAHAGLANASYHLDDFSSAVREWAFAYPLVQNEQTRAWILYRIGICQQRLGWFEMADKTFAQVRQGFPGTEAAARSNAHSGYRSFYVQVGAFNSATSADREIASLRAQRITATRGPDPATGLQVIRAGPFPTYADARMVQSRLAHLHPTAAVLP
jgi:tetratricopeptide (TPR) repeat protein